MPRGLNFRLRMHDVLSKLLLPNPDSFDPNKTHEIVISKLSGTLTDDTQSGISNISRSHLPSLQPPPVEIGPTEAQVVHHEHVQPEHMGRQYKGDTIMSGSSTMVQGDINIVYSCPQKHPSPIEHGFHDPVWAATTIGLEVALGDALEQVGLGGTLAARSVIERCLRELGLAERLAMQTNEQRVEQKCIREFKQTFDDATHACRKSLTLKHWDARENAISKAEKQTCGWIYDTEQYFNFEFQKYAILCLLGNPGSGKSVLMKSFYEARKCKARERPTILLRFFFNAGGSADEKSEQALYRALIIGMLDGSKLAQGQVVARFLEKKRESGGHEVLWETAELNKLFWSLIEETDSQDVEVFIDALDECSDKEMLRIVQDFQKAVEIANTCPSLKLCWSSRPYGYIKLESDQNMELIVDKRNRNDIKTFVRRFWSSIAGGGLRQIGEDIIHRADGIFLWALKTSEMLFERFREGYDLGHLQQMLRDVPQDLSSFYHNIYKSPNFTDSEMQELRVLASIVLGAFRPLRVPELYTAMKLQHPECTMEGMLLPPEADEKKPKIESFIRYLTHISRGLIGTFDISDNRAEGYETSGNPLALRRVQFMHESAREFFLQTDLPILRKGGQGSGLWECHFNIVKAGLAGLSKVCKSLGEEMDGCQEVQYFTSDRAVNQMIPLLPGFRKEISPGLPFLEKYMSDHFAEHLTEIYMSENVSVHDRKCFPSIACRREALAAHMILLCWDVMRNEGMTVAMKRQLSMLPALAASFGLDREMLTKYVDWPIRMVTVIEYLRKHSLTFPFDRDKAAVCDKRPRQEFAVSFAIEARRHPSARSATHTYVNEHSNDPVSLDFLCTLHFEVAKYQARRLRFGDLHTQDVLSYQQDEESSTIHAYSLRISTVPLTSHGKLRDGRLAYFNTSPLSCLSIAEPCDLLSILWSNSERHEYVQPISDLKVLNVGWWPLRWCQKFVLEEPGRRLTLLVTESHEIKELLACIGAQFEHLADETRNYEGRVLLNLPEMDSPKLQQCVLREGAAASSNI